MVRRLGLPVDAHGTHAALERIVGSDEVVGHEFGCVTVVEHAKRGRLQPGGVQQRRAGLCPASSFGKREGCGVFGLARKRESSRAPGPALHRAP